MNKKIIGIIVVIIAILILGFSIYTQNTVKIGNTYFAIPEGYKVVDEGDYYNLSSDINSICIVKKVHQENVEKLIDGYTHSKKSSDNDTLEISKFKVDNYDVYKSVSAKNAKTVHYWLVKDKKTTYEFFTWSGDSNTDRVVTNLIKTMKPFIF
ncbi:hypothetical protein [Methanobrevibacter sp.]|uniref:hypothetical protein n=1 Tax=Methanobrevibacter sp. TaxID=66852 RepID=UPI0038679E6F